MDTAHDDRDAALALVLAGGPLAPRLALLRQAGSPTAAVSLPPAALRGAGLEEAACRALHRPDPRPLARARDWLEGGPDRHLVWLGHPDYPPLLAALPLPPLALFIAGHPERLWQPSVAVVGSRAASHGGRETAARLATALCRHGLQVASGLAAGIDAAAHAAALAASGTGVAVIGTGPDGCYPARHAALQADLARHGAVVSEYPPGTPPRPYHFPARNRILAGLCLAVVVVEAARRSGALLTARLATEAGREVFAVPGSVNNPLARGCHHLLREGAGLLESVEDLLPALVPLAARMGLDLRARLDGVDGSGPPAALPAGPEDAPGREVWRALETDPVDMDELARRTGLTVDRLSSILPALELEGWVTCQHGRFVRSSPTPTPIAPPGAGRG